MSMNPIEATEAIKSEYIAYLQSMLQVKDKTINTSTVRAFSDYTFVKGPFLESTPPYVEDKTLDDLVEQGLASKEFRQIGTAVNISRTLYVHQVKSFKKLVGNKRNIVVATGTGSGKTECFLFPIIDYMMKEKVIGSLCPGVRALLLYPMNALANDQMKRLRDLLLNYPDITFGRYTGETLEREKDAQEAYIQKKELELNAKKLRRGIDYKDADLMPLPNELISREAMRDNPPHILLTNYAMLEYLLIRPKDNVFFDGDKSFNWKFIVLDEAHTYKGANGTEIALLIRRLKERISHNIPLDLRCIATSATLGSKEALPALAEFASNIFGEPFAVDDIITSERVKRFSNDSCKKNSIDFYEQLKDEIHMLENEEDAGRVAYEKLADDGRIIDIQDCLDKKPLILSDVAKIVFHDYPDERQRLKGLVDLIELGVMAKPDVSSAALLPARYHLFVRALEGMFVSLYPKKQVYFDRKEMIKVDGKEIPVFELANCQQCGQEYIVGIEREGYLRPITDASEKLEYFLLTDDTVEEELELNGDDEAFAVADIDKVEAYELCTICGKIEAVGAKMRQDCCEVKDRNKLIKIYKMKLHGNAREVNACASCGSVSPAIIKRFITANQPATYIIANSIYKMLPAEKVNYWKPEKIIEDDFFADESPDIDTPLAFIEENKRKLLVFSDNRQEAAFFAAYMDNKYNQQMWRKTMVDILQKHECISLGDFIILLSTAADKLSLFSPNFSKIEKDILTGVYVVKEFISFERKQGLEGSGYIRFYPKKIALNKSYWGLEPEEIWELFCVLLDTLRISGATVFPDNVKPEDDVFNPRNRNVFFRKEESGSFRGGQISSFLPVGSANNRRYDYIKKVFATMGKDKNDALKVLEEIYGLFMRSNMDDYFEKRTSGSEGILVQLEYKNWYIKYCNEEDRAYRCRRCGKVTYHNVRNVCPEFRCNGELEELKVKEYRNDPYLTKVYSDSRIIPLTAKEHTGQLNKDAAGNNQARFEAGDINLLSCTTTFEMGVDVGQLEAIFLRNVPPETANYIQRSGRAGRRTSSTAFSVTYARRNSHDLNFFETPTEIICGKIKAPYIEIDNEKIAERHVNSIVLSWFFRNGSKGEFFFDGMVKSILGSDSVEGIREAIRQEMQCRPQSLYDSIKYVLPQHVFSRLKIDEWMFVERLVGEDGILTKAIDEKNYDMDALNDALEKRNTEKKINDDLIRLINTFEKQPTLTFLASNSVIPKYGFPVDVVNLDVLSNEAEAAEIELSRDLKIAISEYAPGSEIIAAGKMWKSHSLNKVRDKEWPAYNYYECKKCGFSTFPDEITTIEDKSPAEKNCDICGAGMKQVKVIRPIFGFSTASQEPSKKVRDSKPRRYYPTSVKFGGFDELDQYQRQERLEGEFKFNGSVFADYSPQGKLLVMNKGTSGSGLFICKYCGYGSNPTKDFKHKNKFGHDCKSKTPANVSLGHIFTSDVLILRFPGKEVPSYENKNLWISLLYAIIEGATDELGIVRDDLNGCIYQTKTNPELVLFDETPGGAGHVKRVFSQLETVLYRALYRVDGHCNCGEETTCYGCLRSYSNQTYHEEMSRGMVKEYLTKLLKK